MSVAGQGECGIKGLGGPLERSWTCGLCFYYLHFIVYFE